jgi:hypothetical protein
MGALGGVPLMFGEGVLESDHFVHATNGRIASGNEDDTYRCVYCVCVFVCVYIHMCVCVCVYIYIYMHVCSCTGCEGVAHDAE